MSKNWLGPHIWIKAASNARKIIASSPQRQAYTLICRIVDTKGQRVSNEIKKTVRTNNGVSLTLAIIGGLIYSAVVSVALVIFDKLYRYFSTNPGSGPRKTIIGSIIDFEKDKTLCCTILDIDKDDVSDFTAIAKAYEQKRLKESLDAAEKTGKEKAKANKRLEILGEAKKWLEKNCNTDLYIRYIHARWIYDLYQQAHKFNLLGGKLTWEIIQTIIDKEVATDFMRDRTLCCEILDIEEDHVLNLMEVQNSYAKKVYEEPPDAARTTGTEEQKSQERAKATKRLQILGEAKEWLEKDLKGSFSLYIRFFDASWISDFYKQAKKFQVTVPNEELTWGIIKKIIDEEFTIDFITDRLLCCKILGIDEDCARDSSKVYDAYCCKWDNYLKMRMSNADLKERKICEYAKNWLQHNCQGLFFPYQRSIHARWIYDFYAQARKFKIELSNGKLTWEIIQKIIDEEVGASSSSSSSSGFGSSSGFRPEVTTDLARDRTLCCEILGIDNQEIEKIEKIKKIEKAFREKSRTEHPDQAVKRGKEKAKATKRFQILGEAKEWLEKDLKGSVSLYIRSSDASWIHTFYQQANTFNVALSNGKLTWGIIQTIINQEFGTGSDPSTSTSTGSGSGPELTTDFTIDKKLCCEILGIQEYSSVDSAVLNKAYSSRNLTAGLHTPGSTEMEKNKRRTMQATLKNAQNWLGTISSFKNRYLRSRNATWIHDFYQQAEEFQVTLPKQELTWEVIQTIIDKRVEAPLQQLQT